jgi:hypothetical protein
MDTLPAGSYLNFATELRIRFCAVETEDSNKVTSRVLLSIDLIAANPSYYTTFTSDYKCAQQ